MNTASENHKEASAKLMECLNRDHGINTAEGVRALVNAMVANMRNDMQSRTDMLNNAALYSGMASAALIDYAKVLEEGE